MDLKIPKQELRPGRAKLLFVGSEEIALFQVGADYFAVDNHCPHQHFSKLNEGSLEGPVVTCPMHGWSFDLTSGACVNGEGRLRKYEVTEDGEFVYIRQSLREDGWA